MQNEREMMSLNKLISYSTIRRDYQAHYLVEPIIVDHYAKAISPFFTRYFVAAAVSPNAVTVLMMIFGVVGGLLFAIPNTLSRVCGLVLIHLWYVMDCSDGEVARISKRFSKFGTELDYTAHIVCHPIFCSAFAYSLISMARYNSQVILFVSLAGLSAELVLRNLMSFFLIYDLKVNKVVSAPRKHGPLKTLLIHLINAFTLYPNFALLFPVAYFIDCACGTSISMYYLFMQTAVSSFMAVRVSIKWIRTIVRL
jgi:phosphatidylglycerophosphate synthase